MTRKEVIKAVTQLVNEIFDRIEKLEKEVKELREFASTAKTGRVQGALSEQVDKELVMYCAMPSTVGDLTVLVGEKYGLTRNAVQKRLSKLVAKGVLVRDGKGRYVQKEMADVDWEGFERWEKEVGEETGEDYTTQF